MQDTRRRSGGSPNPYVSPQPYMYTPQQQHQQQQHYYMQQQYMMQQVRLRCHYRLPVPLNVWGYCRVLLRLPSSALCQDAVWTLQGIRHYAGPWVPQQVGPAGSGQMLGPTYAGGTHWFPPPPPSQPGKLRSMGLLDVTVHAACFYVPDPRGLPHNLWCTHCRARPVSYLILYENAGGPRGYAAVQGGAMHPAYAGGYAVSMYAGMGPYPAMVPQAAAPYPTSPVLNPALAAAPSAGFSVPSSSNSSRQTSLTEPMPRPSREKRSSASPAQRAQYDLS